MRKFNSFEDKNIKFLVQNQIDFSTVQITETGLKKSILDATAPVRTYFFEKKLHDYSIQQKGEIGKVYVKSRIFDESSVKETKSSLYRPETKDGDPRIWIYGLKEFVNADDIFILIIFDNILNVININRIDIESVYNSKIITPLKEFIEEVSKSKRSTSEELLNLIKTNIADWKKSEILADTGIGRTIESLLGISMNSSKEADYKGIELKSKREKSKVRSALFTNAPNWDLSKLKSGQQIVDKYGYLDSKTNHKALRVTVKALKLNPQKLSLNVDYNKGYLELLEMIEQNSVLTKIDDVSVWLLTKLHERLLEKHRETFWIDVETKIQNENEYFRITNIEHTKNPITSQFDTLLEQGKISLDLLLGRSSGGDTYSFKIGKKDRNLLFPESEIYKIN